MITKDAAGLKTKLESDEPSTITYDADKPEVLLAEDEVIGNRKLNVKKVTITPVDSVFAK